MAEKVLYAELTPREFKERLAAAPVAYLPLGTLEWHGRHLPLGADGLQSQGFFERLARRAGGVVLPKLFFGPDRRHSEGERQYYGMDIAGLPERPPEQLPGSAYWMPQELFLQVLRSILEQLKRAGFRVVVAHGHGPSTIAFRDNAERWERQFGLRLFICWREDESDGLGIQTDHAAANETSLMMALRGDLVQMDNLPGDPGAQLRGVGGEDPRKAASAERGEKAIQVQVERMATLLRGALAEDG